MAWADGALSLYVYNKISVVLIDSLFLNVSVAIIYEMMETGKALIEKGKGSDKLKKELKGLCGEAGQILKIEEEGSAYDQLRLYLEETAKAL